MQVRELGGFLLSGRSVGCSFLALFDQGFDLLAAFLADLFVKSRAVTVASRLAAFFAAFFTDGLVESMAMGLFRSLTTLAADHLVKFRTILFLDGLAAFLTGFANAHAGFALWGWGGHDWNLVRFLDSHLPEV